MNILSEKKIRENGIKANFHRLDESFMKELWRKYYGMEYSLDQIAFTAIGRFVKASNLEGSEYICVWAYPFRISTTELDINPELVWDILNRIKCCENCRHCEDMIDDFGGCSKMFNVLVSKGDYDNDRCQLQVDDDLNEYNSGTDIRVEYPHKSYEYDFEEDTEKLYKVVVGNTFNCKHHEFKEYK